MACTPLYCLFQTLEARLQVGERLVVALKVAIVEGQPYRGGAALFHECNVCLTHKVVEETREEEMRLLGAKHVDDGRADPMFRPRLAVDKVLQVHPPADTGTS